MLVSLGSYVLCDGTLSGGVAISELRCRGDRLFDFVIPVGDDNPIALNRVTTTIDLSFVVKRVLHDVRTAEKFILTLDNNIPAAGTITLTTTGPSPSTRVIANGFLIDHTLLMESGATLFHQYHLTGGPPVAP